MCLLERTHELSVCLLPHLCVCIDHWSRTRVWSPFVWSPSHEKNRVNSTLLLPFILEANIINFCADISDNLVAAKWVKSTVTRYPDLFLPTTIDKLLPLPFWWYPGLESGRRIDIHIDEVHSHRNPVWILLEVARFFRNWGSQFLFLGFQATSTFNPPLDSTQAWRVGRPPGDFYYTFTTSRFSQEFYHRPCNSFLDFI